MSKIEKIDFQIIDSSIPPKEITRLLGVSPDVELLKGERNKEFCLPRMNLWALSSKNEYVDLQGHWDEIKDCLLRVVDEINRVAKFGVVKITIVVTGRGRLPSIMIPVDLSKFAGQINAVIDIDHLQS